MTALQAIEKLKEASAMSHGSFKTEIDVIEAEIIRLKAVVNSMDDKLRKIETIVNPANGRI